MEGTYKISTWAIIVAYTFILFWWSLGSDTVYVYVVEYRRSGEFLSFLQWASSLSNTFELSSLFHLTVSGFQTMTFVGVTNNITGVSEAEG